MLEEPRGAGALLHTEVERVDLGVHHGRHLHGRIEHRTLRFAFGRGWHCSLQFGQRRPVAVEVIEGSRRYDVVIPRTPDPYVQVARRIALLSLAGIILARLAGRARRGDPS